MQKSTVIYKTDGDVIVNDTEIDSALNKMRQVTKTLQSKLRRYASVDDELFHNPITTVYDNLTLCHANYTCINALYIMYSGTR